MTQNNFDEWFTLHVMLTLARESMLGLYDEDKITEHNEDPEEE